ncbi:MAG: L,D-transpeptidase family protein [Bacteroidales bacterium]
MAFRRFRKRRLIYFIAVPLLVVALAFVALTLFSQKPPTEKIELARKAIADAIKDQAEIYAPEQLAIAQKKWQSAMDEWKLNNEKNAILRNYSKTIVYADLAIKRAGEAKEDAIKRKQELTIEIQAGIKLLKESVNYIEQATGKLPLNHNIRKRLTPFIMKLNELESAYEREDLLSAKKTIETIKTNIEALKRQTTNLLNEYFESFPRWVRLDQEMKQWSKNTGGVSLVVDKFSKRCIVYKAGKVLKEYEVELGLNWLGDKIQRGDKATPEGKYSITAKKSGSKTIYHKALLINFPNEEDKRRFNAMKAKGMLSRNAHIGGLIEIHGGGGKGIDWTDGCVALENRDMDNLYAICSVGTPVAIVGSLTPLDKIFNLEDVK